MSAIQLILVFLVSCISGMGSILDEWQTHRPLIACTLIGLVLGDITTGIIIGGTLEMIALGWMNIGAAVAPDAALASIISTILVITGGTRYQRRYFACDSSSCSWSSTYNSSSYNYSCIPTHG